jgi:small subunit ribosomal protein S5
MADKNTDTTQMATATTEKPVAATAAENNTDERTAAHSHKARTRGRGGPRRGGRRDRGDGRDRTPEFAQKIIGIRRVTRVMAGGRRFGFSVSMVIGDKKGRVGVGVGKASDTALAIEKAIRDAKKEMVTITRTKTGSILHNVEAKYGSTVLEIRPAQGRGLVAGASVRTVLELGGVTDVTAKILSRSKNKTNIARAAVVALKKLTK